MTVPGPTAALIPGLRIDPNDPQIFCPVTAYRETKHAIISRNL